MNANPPPASPPPASSREMLGEIVRMSFDSLRAHGLRSLLTTLGVVIGVATVVAMVSIIQGFNRSVERSISAFGSHIIYVRMFKPGFFVGGFPDSLRHRQAFTVEDAQAIRAQCPDVGSVSVMGFMENATISWGGHSSRGLELLGADPRIQEVLRYDPAVGRFFTDEEVQRREPVIVIGKDIHDGLFVGGENPIGRTVHLNGKPFRVIGELEPKGRSLFSNPDELLTIPYTTLEKYFPPPPDAPFYVPKRGHFYLNAVAVSPERTAAAVDQIRSLLRVRRGLRSNQPDNFAVLTEESLTELYNQLTGATYAVMILISSIALLVGGIGVMNIMLVAVTERTREIGLRKAVGARGRTILLQFLIEAAALTAFGGIVGIALGAGVGQLVRLVSPLPAFTPLWAVLVAFGFSVAVGVFFGLHPAMQAARLDPVEAMRFE
jgi:putative ABC transport system permease protein